MIVGLTGNSGTGASTVAGFWRELGCNVCHFDHAGHRLMEKARVRKALGIPGFENLTGAEARKFLRERAFTEPELLARISLAMHPVMKRWVGFMADKHRNSPGIWVLEGALLFELGLERVFDRIVAVVDTPERAFSRILQRDGLSGAAVEGRWRNQLPPGEKAGRSCIVIDNSGDLDHLREVSTSAYGRLLSMEVDCGEQNP